MAVPKYAQRIARLPEVFELLAGHPEGLPLADLAERIGVPPDELREDLFAFYTADVQDLLLGLTRPSVLEFVGRGGDDTVDPGKAEVVRLIHERPEELGVEYVDASELALVYAAARSLLEIEPGNEDLQGAVDTLSETMLGNPLEASQRKAWNAPLEDLQAAANQHRLVRITYSRSWNVGVTDRVIEPYRLVQTRRGWEVDAGVADAPGQVRTFLLSNIRDYEVLPETFTPPTDVAGRIERNRATSRVRVRIPHAARWAADFYAERVGVVEDDEESVTLDLDLLPPVEHRVGLLGLAAGPDAQVLEPARLVAEIGRVAGELLAHHRG